MLFMPFGLEMQSILVAPPSFLTKGGPCFLDEATRSRLRRNRVALLKKRVFSGF